MLSPSMLENLTEVPGRPTAGAPTPGAPASRCRVSLVRRPSAAHLHALRHPEPRIVPIDAERVLAPHLIGRHAGAQRELEPAHRLTVVAHARIRARHARRPLAREPRVELDGALIRGHR